MHVMRCLAAGGGGSQFSVQRLALQDVDGRWAAATSMPWQRHNTIPISHMSCWCQYMPRRGDASYRRYVCGELLDTVLVPAAAEACGCVCGMACCCGRRRQANWSPRSFRRTRLCRRGMQATMLMNVWDCLLQRQTVF